MGLKIPWKQLISYVLVKNAQVGVEICYFDAKNGEILFIPHAQQPTDGDNFYLL